MAGRVGQNQEMSENEGGNGVLEGLEAVRTRPGMFVGDTTERGLHHLILEVVGNTLDQVLGGRAKTLRVDVDRNDQVTVDDDGNGISVEPINGVSFLETIFTKLSYLGTVDGHFPHVHLTPGIQGFGMGSLSALSARVDVESRTKGTVWRAAFERGVCVEKLHAVGPASASGTTVRFLPDTEIFKGARIDRQRLKQRLLELARLVPALRVHHQGEVLDGNGGISGWVRELAPDVIDVLAGSHLLNDVQVDFALGWSPSGREARHLSFVNLCTTHNGIHDKAFESALRTSAGDLWKVAKRGLVSVLHLKMLHPRFGDPTKQRLDSEDAREPVTAAVSATMTSSFWDAIRHALQTRGAAE